MIALLMRRLVLVSFLAVLILTGLDLLDASPDKILVSPAGAATMPSPTIAAPQMTVLRIPVDKAARAKFPHDPRKLVDLVAFLNRLVNTAMKPTEDDSHYGRDLWVQFPPDGQGDCEDYAITKFGILEDMGWNVVARAKLVQVGLNVPGASEQDGHEILALRLPSGAVAYLDMNFPEPMTRRELERAGYRFFDWRA